MTITYYVARTAEGLDTPAQKRKVGSGGYGYRTVGVALRYTPPGGYVEERHTDGASDWGGRIVAEKPVAMACEATANGEFLECEGDES